VVSRDDRRAAARLRYWPEYVFEAYVNHESDVVYLTGFPDIESSRPHSRLNS